MPNLLIYSLDKTRAVANGYVCFTAWRCCTWAKISTHLRHHHRPGHVRHSGPGSRSKCTERDKRQTTAGPVEVGEENTGVCVFVCVRAQASHGTTLGEGETKGVVCTSGSRRKRAGGGRERTASRKGRKLGHEPRPGTTVPETKGRGAVRSPVPPGASDVERAVGQARTAAAAAYHFSLHASQTPPKQQCPEASLFLSPVPPKFTLFYKLRFVGFTSYFRTLKLLVGSRV